MKKAILIAVALLSITACSSDRKEPDGNMRWIDVYYADSGEKIISSEQRAIVAEDNITALIKDAVEQMRQTPIGNNLKPLFPEGTQLVGAKFDHGVARIEFSGEYLTLDGMDKTAADYGILMTLSNFWNIRAVEITVNGAIITPEFSQKDIATEIPKWQN